MSELCPNCPKSNRRLPSLQCSANAPHYKPYARKCRQIPTQAFYSKKIIKCPTPYLSSLSCLCPHTLRTIIPHYSEAQGIYMIICPSLPLVLPHGKNRKEIRNNPQRCQEIHLLLQHEKNINFILTPLHFFLAYPLWKNNGFFREDRDF